jgi:thioredoxin-like negative regulator of GroEL
MTAESAGKSGGAGAGKGAGGGGGKGRGGGGDSAVVDLTEANFNALVMESTDHWIVDFYAPWYVRAGTSTYKHVLCLSSIRLLIPL